MLEGKDILCFGDDYGRMPSTFQRLVKELSRKNRVLWVNSLGERKINVSFRDLGRIIEKVRPVRTGRACRDDNVTVVSLLAVPLAYDWGFISQLNTAFILFQLRKAMKKINMQEPIVMSSVRGIFDIIEPLPKKTLAYFCLDDYKRLCLDGGNFLEQKEACLMGRASVTFVTSKVLAEMKKGSGRNIVYMGQGVDYGHFSKAQTDIEIPLDVRGIKRPIIGFSGSISHWVDLELIKKIAESHPDWSVVLIGREEEDLTQLGRVKNIYYLGRKDYALMPAYIKGFDCAVIPFRVNELTRCVNPLKALEYLAAGKPVVATFLPDLEETGGLVYLAHNADEFIGCIEKAIGGDSPEQVTKRLEYSLNYTWANRAEFVSGILERIVK